MLKEERTTKTTVVILVIIAAVLSIFVYEYSTFTSKKIVDIASHEARSDARIEAEIARVAASDNDVQLLMTIPGINCFTVVAIKSRIGDDVSRFATKKHLCSYVGVVPKANNSAEYISEHNHVKQGDKVLKYALTGLSGLLFPKAYALSQPLSTSDVKLVLTKVNIRLS
jgi:transposase